MRLSKNKTMLAIFAFLIAFPIMLSNNAFSHGDAPSNCENRYDATITSMTVSNWTQNFDPISDPDTQFAAQIEDGYDVTFTLHTTNVSSQNNTVAGTSWYRHSAFGFGSGMCVDNAGPDQDISVTVHVDPPSGIPDGYQQDNIEWGAWPQVIQLSYGVTWHSQPEQEPQQNGIPFARSTEDNDEVEDNEPEEDLDDDVSGFVMSPFIYKSEESTTSVTDAGNVTLEQPPREDVLHINGTLASYQFLNETGVMQLHILSGNWRLAMNDTAVVDFDADFTMLRSDGNGREVFSLGNLTSVSASNMNLVNNMISINSAIDYHAYGEMTRTNVTITVQRLNVIVIELEGMGAPMYGVIDKIVLVKDGQPIVMDRQFDMI
jgi:hypothetical protein